MFKLVLLGVWVNLVVAGAILFSSGKYQDFLGSDEPGADRGVKTATTALPPVSIALIREGGVVGYIILELAFNHAEEGKAANMPFEFIFRDAVVNSLYGNTEIDEEMLEDLRLEELQDTIKQRVEARIGPDILFDVLIQNIDYRSMEQIRDNQLRK